MAAARAAGARESLDRRADSLALDSGLVCGEEDTLATVVARLRLCRGRMVVVVDTAGRPLRALRDSDVVSVFRCV